MQAVMAPLSYLVNIAVVRDRFENFRFGSQQFDMPVHNIVDRTMLQQQPADTSNAGRTSSGGGKQISGGAIAAIVVCSVVALVGIMVVAFLVHREKRGRPVFSPLLDAGGTRSTEFSNMQQGRPEKYSAPPPSVLISAHVGTSV